MDLASIHLLLIRPQGRALFPFYPAQIFPIILVAFSYLLRICLTAKVSSFKPQVGINCLFAGKGKRRENMLLKHFIIMSSERPSLWLEHQGVKSLKVIVQKLKARPREKYDWPKVTEWLHNYLTKKWPHCFEIPALFPNLLRTCKCMGTVN